MDDFLTPAQVADRLKVPRRRVEDWLRAGKLRGFKFGKEWRVKASDLEAFIAASRVEPPTPKASADAR